MNYLTIYKSSLLDGIGWRVVLFVSGCSHKCKGCHNPESWDRNAGKEFTDSVKEELFSYINHKEIDGLTISGGDPLFNANISAVTSLCKEFKERFPSKTIWLYTGSLYETVKDYEVMKYVDVIVDGPFILEQRNTKLHFRGSSNQRVIDVKSGKVIDYKEDDIIREG